MHPLHGDPFCHVNSSFSSYRRPSMLQVGLKLGKFLGWRDVTPPRIGTYIRHTKEPRRKDESALFFSMMLHLVKREMNIFEIIKNDAANILSA